MIFLPPKHKQSTSPTTTIFSRQFVYVSLLIILVCTTTYIVTTHYFSPNIHSKVLDWEEKHGFGVYDRPGIASRIFRGVGAAVNRTKVPKLVIDIKFQDMQALYKKRNEALEKGILIKSDKDLVPAKIRYYDQTIKAKLRLKGDWTDHLTGEKWSFRIQLKGKSQLFGLRRFSIQHPKVRGYQGEALFFETLKHVGVLAPRYIFVDVVINGNRIGIMALEEHFSKEMLESNERREGVIVRFDESLLWSARASKGSDFNDFVFHNYKSATIDAFKSSKIKKSKKLSSDYAVAVGLLRGFVNGSIPASEAFDAELLGKYLAVVELFGARHSVYWHNQRFYLNPITLKLEPIGFDANIQRRRPINSIAGQREPFVVALLQDPKVFSVYTETLKTLGNDILNGDLISKLRATEASALEVLHTEFYFLGSFPMDYLRKRTEYLLSAQEEQLKSINVNYRNYPEIVKGYMVRDEEGLYLELLNLVPYDVLISDISCVSKTGDKLLSSGDQLDQVSLPLRLTPTPTQTLPESSRLRLLPNLPEGCDIEIAAAIQGNPKMFFSKAIPYFPPMRSHPLPNSDVRTQLEKHDFLELDEINSRFVIQSGKWHVSESIIIPVGYDLIVQPGTTLQFEQKGGLFAYGATELSGEEGNPVVLEGLEKENTQGTWQGVVVMNATRPSVWSNVYVRNTTGVEQSVWQLTGGVTFYKSNITLKSCSFVKNKGEDALNIIQSDFLIKNITISDTASDAFDSDFSNGLIEGGLFENIGQAGGGDAIDISGSKVKIKGTKFFNINDKALSVGERSLMEAENVVVVHAGTGAASKDGSRLTIKDSTIKFAKNAGLMAYVKKQEFGPGHITATNVLFSSEVADARVQDGSSVIIDGVEVKSENVDVNKLYETVMKPGLRP